MARRRFIDYKPNRCREPSGTAPKPRSARAAFRKEVRQGFLYTARCSDPGGSKAKSSPRCGPHVAAKQEIVMHSSAPNHSHVLVVDDDLLTREVLSLILGAEGYRVTTADDGRDALDQLRHGEHPDLIV